MIVNIIVTINVSTKYKYIDICGVILLNIIIGILCNIYTSNKCFPNHDSALESINIFIVNNIMASIKHILNIISNTKVL